MAGNGQLPSSGGHALRASRPVHAAGAPGLSSPAQVNIGDTVWHGRKVKGKHNLPRSPTLNSSQPTWSVLLGLLELLVGCVISGTRIQELT